MLRSCDCILELYEDINVWIYVINWSPVKVGAHLLEQILRCFLLSSGSLWGRVEEQSLWSSRHLGEQSPAALLRSLVYLNTKYFSLRTVEQHLRLSFANVYGPDSIHPVTKEMTVRIRIPSISQDHQGQSGTLGIFAGVGIF